MKQTTWNLTEFSELEESVLTSYAIPLKRHVKKGIPATVFFAIIITVATIGAAARSVCARANATTFDVPHSLMAVAHSGIGQEAPLKSLFAGRFNAEWSESTENKLLASLDRDEAFTKAELEEQTVDSIYFNQQEDMSPQADRISREEIKRIVKQRKLV